MRKQILKQVRNVPEITKCQKSSAKLLHSIASSASILFGQAICGTLNSHRSVMQAHDLEGSHRTQAIVKSLIGESNSPCEQVSPTT